MVGRIYQEVSQALKNDPIVEAPSDLVLVGRVMGLLSNLGKQLGSEVNLFTTLLPFLSNDGSPLVSDKKTPTV